MRRDYTLLQAATFISFTGDWILSGGAGIVPIIAIQGLGYCAAGAFVLVALPRAPIGRDDDGERAMAGSASSSIVEA